MKVSILSLGTLPLSCWAHLGAKTGWLYLR